MYRCLFNHELLIAGTTQTPCQRYEDDICDEQLRLFMDELCDTDVDAVMLCPTAWRRNLWHSKVDPHWEEEAPHIKEPSFGADLKYYEKAYYRWRRYMLSGKDPVAVSMEAAKANGLAVFASYRMNDHHHQYLPVSPTHNKIYLEKQAEHFLPGDRELDRYGRDSKPIFGYLNYHDQEVREYYYSILRELMENYDFDGMELDFMRSPAYFPDNEIEAGIQVMNGFVKSIRDMLDEFSALRGKNLPLCVRVPMNLKDALRIGLDVAFWDAQGWIDMVNVSPFYINDLRTDVPSYKAALTRARVYGEMHFICDAGRMPRSTFENNITHKTNREMYWALAEKYLLEGADGLSFFNFDYVRDHHFSEPRREGDFGCEPPFDVLRGILDTDALAQRQKHYYIRADQMNVRMLSAEVQLCLPRDFTACGKAVLRVIMENVSEQNQIEAKWDGQVLRRIQWMGELFPPLTAEGIPAYHRLRFYEVPLSLLQKGVHCIEVSNQNMQAGWTSHPVAWTAVELGLY